MIIAQSKPQVLRREFFAILLIVLASLVSPVLAAESSQSSSGTSGSDSLPDLGAPDRRTGSVAVQPGSGGLAIEGNFDRQRVVIAPEYSEQTGLSLGVVLAAMLGEHAAVGVLLNVGAEKKEFLINAGYVIDAHQRFIVTAGRLKQFLDYAFLSGTEKVGLTQTSGALSYQLQLGNEFLRFLELNGYLARTTSQDLSDKTFVVDSATVYELWNDPRRIAGGNVAGLQGKIGFSPIKDSLVKVSLGTERLRYDFLAGSDSVNRLTGGLEWTQQFPGRYSARLAAETFASQNRYSIGVERSLSGADGGRHNLGVSFVNVHGRGGLGNDRQLMLTYSYLFGAGGTGGRPAAAYDSTDSLSSFARSSPVVDASASGLDRLLISQVASRPSFIPSRVIARIDPTALPTRLSSIDKTTLPAGTTVNPATGDITTPLGVAVMGIAGITRNGAALANTGAFSLSGNNLVTRPGKITLPAAGGVDTYVVTLNNQGGGTTLVTITVSTRMISISVGPGTLVDTEPPMVTNGPYVIGTTASTTTIQVTFNETGTGYILALPATAATPSISAVLAGQAFTLKANEASRVTIGGLMATTSYRIYFVAKDAANNVMKAAEHIDITTTVPSASVVQGGLTWMPMSGSGIMYTFAQAQVACAGSINGQTGWRLPDVVELQALADSRTSLPGWPLSAYWSSRPSGMFPGFAHQAIELGRPNGGYWEALDTATIYLACVR